MRNILKKYSNMSDEEREDLEGLYIMDLVQDTMAETSIYINCKSIETLVNIIKELLEYANIPIKELINRIFKIIDAPDKSVDDIEILEIDDLIELLTEKDDDFDCIYMDWDVIREFDYEDYKCSLSTNGDKYVIIYKQDDKANVLIFNNYEDMLCSLIDYSILREQLNVE